MVLDKLHGQTKLPRYYFREEVHTNTYKIKLKDTCSGGREKTLLPIEKETLGMEETFAQSTPDSPIGLGKRSHNYNFSR